MSDYEQGQQDLARKIYDIILNDYEFCLIPHHNDREVAYYFDNKLMTIFNTIKQLIGEHHGERTARKS